MGALLSTAPAAAAGALLTHAKAHHGQGATFDVELPNLQHALKWLFGHSQWLDAIDLALILDTYLDTVGNWQQDVNNLELGLAAADRLGDSAVGRRALLLHNLAVLHLVRGEVAEAEHGLDEAVVLQRSLGDIRAVARALHYLGRVHAARHDWPRPQEILAESLALSDAVGDLRSTRATLHEIGTLYLEQGDYTTAEDHYMRGRMEGDRQNPRDVAATEHQLGILALRREDLDEAARRFLTALQMERASGLQKASLRHCSHLARWRVARARHGKLATFGWPVWLCLTGWVRTQLSP